MFDMFPIFIHRQTADAKIGYLYDDFEKDFLSICEEHHRSNRALAFAFILYDLQNATIAKVLADRHYWNALDRLSGKYLSVYHVDTSMPDGRKVSRRFQDPHWRSTKVVKKYITETVPDDLPSLLFFQVAEGEVKDSLTIPLKEREMESCFSEIVSYVSAAVEVLRMVQIRYRNNRSEIFEELRRKVRSTHRKATFKRVFKQAVPVIEFVSIFKV